MKGHTVEVGGMFTPLHEKSPQQCRLILSVLTILKFSHESGSVQCMLQL